MHHRLLTVAAAVATWLSGCYTERNPPSNYRYACTDEADCSGAERCFDGLCQIPCTRATEPFACSVVFAGCFNGFCASTCNLEDSNCPDPQSCWNVGASPDNPTIGVCGVACDTTTHEPCAPGLEYCVADFCVPRCDLPEVEEPMLPACPMEWTCTETPEGVGVCVPSVLNGDSQTSEASRS